MIITKKRNIENISISINDTPVEQCSSYKYLGVIFDKNLNWKDHVEYICGKISKSIGGLALLRHRTSIAVLREVYFALVNSYVRYGILVWGNASDTTLEPLKVLLNKAVRIITFAPFGPLDLEPIYRELEFLTLDQTISLEKGKFMHKKEKNLLPTVIANHFDAEARPEHNYNLRRRQNNQNPFRSNTATGRNSIQFHGLNLWNELPEYLKDIDSIPHFKKLLKSHLLG